MVLCRLAHQGGEIETEKCLAHPTNHPQSPTSTSTAISVNKIRMINTTFGTRLVVALTATAMASASSITDILAALAPAPGTKGTRAEVSRLAAEGLRTIYDELLKLDPDAAAQAAVRGDNEYPYFGFIPPFTASLIPGGESVTWTSECFGTTTGNILLSLFLFAKW